MDVACANSYTVYKMMHPDYLTLLDFKTIVSTYLIVSYTSESRAPTDCKAGSKGMYQYQFEQSNHHHINLSRDNVNIATK